MTRASHIGESVEDLKQSFLDNLAYLLGKAPSFASRVDCYQALAYTVRERLIQRWLKTIAAYDQTSAKLVYYLSAEYLMGPQLENNLLHTGLGEAARQAMSELGLDLDELSGLEIEPGLGNGGLGRLAACFLDSMATLNIPAVGYGIRYEHGIFRQVFEDGYQVEKPDYWLRRGDPWEFAHPSGAVEVRFHGWTESYTDAQRRYRVRWVGADHVLGVPHNMMVPGYGTDTVNTLRLWSAHATDAFDLQLFNAGDYTRAVERKVASENLSKVLYPDDTTPQGKELRLQQQYFFTACSLFDILRIFQAQYGQRWDLLPDKAAIQLNDTHPSVAVAELMRLLVDDHLVEWERAWDIACRVFGYTVHTILPEALEEWPVSVFERLLPRHMEIIYEINRRFLDEVRRRHPGDEARAARLSIIRERPDRRVRMAHLAAVGSHAVNGVAALQSDLLRRHTLRDFAELWPDKFQNKTNGVTPRRFLRLANPGLSSLITSRIGDGWLTDLEQLRQLEPLADDPAFRAEWRAVKQANKRVLAERVAADGGPAVDPGALFDVIAKRLHEYKRQLLKALHIVTLYHRLRADPGQDAVPRAFFFAAKAAPGYRMAKLIIKLIHAVGETVNADPRVAGRLRVAFVPNFNVTVAECLYPAADISEQISTAGKEASGTGNMKFALNGALTVGTLDGANIEIRERVGAENFFLFGLTAEEVLALKQAGYRPWEYYERHAELRQAVNSIANGEFSPSHRDLFKPIVDSLLNYDDYLLLADYPAYVACCERAAEAWRDQEAWSRMSILNAARCGYFSSDRTIREYCRDIWGVEPVRL